MGTLALAQALSTDNPECRKAAAYVRENYVMAAYGWTLSAEDAVYLSDIASCRSMTVSFICRSPSCLFFGMDDQWIHDIDSAHFRCPQCGLICQPSEERVLSLADPISGLTFSWPCKWPAFADDGWLKKMAEHGARDTNTSEDLGAFLLETVISLNELLGRVAMPLSLKKMEWNPGIEYLLIDAACPKSQWAHLKAHGVLGAKLNADAPVFESWTELIGLLASVIAGGSAFGSKL